MALDVFLVAGLLADHDDAGMGRTLTEHRLRRVAMQVAARAPERFRAQAADRRDHRGEVPAGFVLEPRGFVGRGCRACCRSVSLRNILSNAADRIGADVRLDRVAVPAGDLVRGTLDHEPTKDLLSGTWLGHPLHPALTDLPIGFWTSAFVLDLVGGRRARRAATQLVAWGVVSAVPTALSGASDWGDTTGVERRVGLVHAVSNSTALVFYAASWWARVRGRHRRGVVLGLAGATAATVGGYLGGHLVQALDVGTNRSTPPPPSEWTQVASIGQVTQTPRRVLAGEAPVIVLRHHGAIVALDARCPHRGGPMDEGELRDGCLTCPWHGSVFRVADGALVRGPTTLDLPSYECRVAGDAVEVRAG
jgi:nitrite reductase/ring-hydroxylating ferredoxin subunit/uncharacterized membrane protein